ncbi:HD domain-containing protein [candidate division WOR-3 bacterium]|nr:HD domain-containing protein [candidate division WOR-3 bacterium]
MIVEDEAITARDIAETLVANGYEVCGTAMTSDDAIEKTVALEPDLILIDIVLSHGKDGIKTAAAIHEKIDVPIVYLTAYTNDTILERAKETEPHGYLIKPFKDRELQTTIEIALYKHANERKLKESLDKLGKALLNTVTALATAVEIRDPYTAGHQRRVAQLAHAIARDLNLAKDKIEAIRIAATIHDIGKLNVPAEILGKPAKLTDAEYEIVRSHSQIGYDILKNVEFPWPVTQIVLQHHERLNGSGYPKGLDDGNILQEAQILAVADVTEAMLSHRPYRPAHSLNATLEELLKNKNTLYNSDAVEACIKLFKEKKFDFETEF